MRFNRSDFLDDTAALGCHTPLELSASKTSFCPGTYVICELIKLNAQLLTGDSSQVCDMDLSSRP